ncbi:MAG: aspartyl protease family protein [Planctomycetes bacterium]|nr:aspartyl protease family protein [Planctomycetota bacterium]
MELANRLEKIGPTASTHHNAILAARLETDDLAKVGERFRAAGRAVKPAEGYPDTVLGESIEGLADFYDRAGVKPTNQLVDTGAAPMPFMALVGLPFVEAYLNGKGPYRLIVDTGGSNGVSLTDDLAKEIGIETLASGSVRGVSGKAPAGHAILSELTIGDIRMRRALTRTFEMPVVLRGVCDGILGTGVFDRARMTLDFQNERLVIEKSSDRAAAGAASRAWIVEDAKIFVPVRVQDQDMLAVVDSGATTCAIAPSALKTLFPEAKLLELGAAGMGVGEGDAPRINLAPSVKFAAFGREMENYSLVGLDMLDTVFGPHLGAQANVLLGMPLLRQMKSFTVDFAACRVWVEWLATE